ncbi:protein kinase [Shewanella sp. AS16]|uniref:serine/threonine-protein kinase n=1 Tax=Shewanella sp. AS16 TaxID=2907625 RepID=UPI001F3A79E6|nr:serine/threonine-protein kinase [Shewanella sp. AS16]MCE9688004.1 protein kinase [Shewanella sp. AS16]
MLTRVQHYRIEKCLARGGMGSVYLAYDEKLSRHVALKLLDTDKGAPQQSLQEARALARLNHPHVVQIYEVIEGESPGLVMEYIKGHDLLTLQRQQILSLPQKLQILSQIAAALAAAHKAGILHCDIKPSNILICDRLQAKLCDFGLAQQPQNAPPSYGSQPYMSPEQRQGKALDERSELFSFAVLAFELLAKRHPFSDADKPRAMDAAGIIPALPTELISLLNKLLDANPGRRGYSSEQVAEVLARIYRDLEFQAQLNQQTMAIPVAKPSRLQGTLTLWGLGLLLCLGLGYAGLDYWRSHQANRYVLVLEPRFDQPTAQEQQLLLQATIDDALRQAVLHTRGTTLISRSELNQNHDNLKQLAQLTGATDIVDTEIDCRVQPCQIKLSRLEPKQLSVLGQVNWPSLSNLDNYSLFQTTQSHWARLFQGLDMQPDKPTMSAVEYQEYLAIYRLSFNTLDAGLLARLDTLLELNPYITAAYSLYREHALKLYHSSEDSALLQRLAQRLDKSPGSYKTSVFYAVDRFWLALSKQDYRDAEQYREKALELGLDPAHAAALGGHLALYQGQYRQAREQYLLAYSLRHDTASLMNLAITEIALGEASQAQQRLTQILGIQPQNWSANVNLGIIYLTHGPVRDAIARFEAVLAQSEDPEILSYLGLAQLIGGQQSEALASMRRSVALSPDVATYRLNLADAELVSGNQAQAEQHYQAVLHLSPQTPVSVGEWLERAQASLHLGSTVAAMRALNEAQKLAPADTNVAYVAALIGSKTGNLDSALVQMEQALASGLAKEWFTLPWFTPLQQREEFAALLQRY